MSVSSVYFKMICNKGIIIFIKAYICTVKTEEKKRLMAAGELLPVMEYFYTIQGEGKYSGAAAYFIRLGGCDVGCHWCDVKESWEMEKHPLTSIRELVNQIDDTVEIVVITGGEPLLWNLELLTSLLQERNIRTHIETSGSSKVTGSWDWFCLSPKKRKMPMEKAYQMANELKMVIFNKADFKFAEREAEKVSEDCLLYLQVEWDRRSKMLAPIVEYVKNNPKWRISVQTHKYLDIP